MRAESTALPGVLIIQSPVYRDARGFFTEVFHRERFRELGLPEAFAQDNHSRSSFNVIRGIHYQLERPQGKLVRSVHGIIFDVAVDLRRGSEHFGQWVGATLEAGDGRSVWIPPGFGHGFLVLSESADVAYSCTAPYDAASNRSIRWDDPEIGIRWPIPYGVAPILSDGDAHAPLLAMADSYQ